MHLKVIQSTMLNINRGTCFYYRSLHQLHTKLIKCDIIYILGICDSVKHMKYPQIYCSTCTS